MSMIEVKGLCFSYESGRKILDNVSFSVEKGEAVVLAGYSGAGKTTLSHCLCGIIPNAVKGDMSGSVTVDGCDIPALPLYECAKHIGLVFQNPDDQLICTAVEDELAFGLENLCVDPAEIRARVDEMLGLFRLKELAGRDPARLSGGQKKLVTIASVLIMGPKALILDEPMTGLDADSRALVFGAIDRLRESGCTIVAVEHDLSLAGYADRMLYLREGRLYDKP